MIIARPMKNEPNLLLGNEHHDLLVKTIDGKHLATHHSPAHGWTFDALEDLSQHFDYQNWDAFLNNVWIGSSEV